MSLREYNSIQPHVIRMLINSYHKKRLVHAYLFEGEKGTKKKEIALEFAKLLYCDQEDACNECINCLRIDHSNHPNIIVIEPVNNTIKKEQILYLQQEYSKTTLEPGPKIYIIDGIDKMSNNAANSILKFIEEPLPDTYTILITDNLHQILPTIISRCQVINFQPVPKIEIINMLEAHHIDSHVAAICAHLTNDLDEALEIAQEEKMIEIIELVKSVGQAMLTKKEDLIALIENNQVNLYKDKKVLNYFLDILLLYIRDIKNIASEETIVFKQEIPFIKTQVHLLSADKIIDNINEVLQAKITLEYNANLVLLIDHLLLNLM